MGSRRGEGGGKVEAGADKAQRHRAASSTARHELQVAVVAVCDSAEYLYLCVCVCVFLIDAAKVKKVPLPLACYQLVSLS